MSNYKTDLIFAHDAGHGWLGVPEALLIQLNIDFAISRYSYLEPTPLGNTVWLEEDGDATLFLEAYRARFGKLPFIVDRDDGARSPVRHFRAWRGTGLGWQAQMQMIENFRARANAASPVAA